MDRPSRPARAGAPWALVVALATVAGVALCVALFAVARDRARKPRVAIAPSAAPPPSVAQHVVAAAPEPIVTAPERRATVPGTPASSLRARPAWGKREHLTPHAKVASQYAPQPTNPLELFLSAAPLGPDFSSGTVICRFQSFNQHDTFAGDDLHARVTFGATPEVANDGPEDANLAFVSAPLVKLGGGDRIAYQVFDRDVFGITPISSATVVFSNAPVVAVDAGAALECRGLGGAALERAIATHSAAAAVTLAEIERATPDESRADWAFPAEPIARAERQISDTAALAGWDEPRVLAHGSGLAAARSKLTTDREKLFDRLYGAAGASFALGPTTVAIAGTDCPGACVPVTVKNDTRATVPLAPLGTVYLASRAEGPHWAQIVADGPPNASPTIAGSATMGARIVTVGALPEGPLLLGMCAKHVCRFARAR